MFGFYEKLIGNNVLKPLLSTFEKFSLVNSRRVFALNAKKQVKRSTEKIYLGTLQKI